MLLTPDMKLVHAVLQVGLPAFFKARRAGIKSSMLFDEAPSIFDLMEQVASQGRLPSLNEVHLATSHQIDQVCPEPLDLSMCIEFIKKRTLVTQLNQQLGQVANIVNDDPQKAINQLSDIITKANWTKGDPYSGNSVASIEELESAYKRAESSGLLGFSSPWPTVDEASRGLQDGEITVLFAKRKVGKTWLTLAWATHIWRKDLKPGEKILIVSMEMSPRQVLQRMAAIDLKLSYKAFRDGRLTTAEKGLFYDWCLRRKNAPPEDPNFIILGSNEIRTARDISVAVGEHRPKIVCVDSFYILGRASGKPLHERILANIQDLKLEVAAGCNVPVLASTQLKGTTGKDVLVADSDDAMGAKAIGDYADATRGLFMDRELKAANQRLWRHMEAREFEGKDVKIAFDLQKMSFGEIEEIKDAGQREKERKASEKNGGGGGGGGEGGGGKKKRLSSAEIAEAVKETSESDGKDDALYV